MRLAVELSQFARTPAHLLTPSQAEVQRKTRGMLPDLQSEMEAAFGTGTGVLPPGAEARKREIHALMVDAMLRPYPPLQALQKELQTTLRTNRENTYFDLPLFLAAINKHLKRTPKFLPMDFFCPSMEAMLAQLTNMYKKSKQLHAQVIFTLVKASMFQEQPHPPRCTCPLCAHIANVSSA